jgi:two-component system, OmpR family, phosphate regulon response regulator OmpR
MNTPKKRILVIDDDQRLCALLSEYLATHGFIVDTLPDSSVGEKYLKHKKVDLLILDRMLPSGDGMNFLARLRHEHNELPIIFLTAKNEDIDRIMGLELGADDYVSKPFNPRELLARIHAIFKRALHPPMGTTIPDRVKIGELIFIPTERVLKNQQETLSLSSTEFSVLCALISHPRQPLTRERLLTLAHGQDHVVFDRAIDTQISRLRKLIEPNPHQPRYIQTVWGTGYMFVPDKEDKHDI